MGEEIIKMKTRCAIKVEAIWIIESKSKGKVQLMANKMVQGKDTMSTSHTRADPTEELFRLRILP